MRMSRMAWACFSERPNRSTRPDFASAAVWLARGRTGEVLLSPDELRVLGCEADGGGGLLLTVEVTRKGFGFSRFEARTQNGVTLVRVYGRRDGEAAGTLALAGAADTNVLLTGEDGGTILYEASGER